MRSDLYPEIEPVLTGHLDTGDGHAVYWEVSGNVRGLPVVFVHGGPGSGAKPIHRRFFDPEIYCIVVFDQRGAGRSRPFGAIERNTTPDLIADMERLREHLRIERWIVFGGSWGSTLGLAYAETHPEQVIALILRGIFLCRPSELHWFLYGMKEVFPENWRRFAGYLPEAERDDILGHYHRRLTDPDPAVHLPAARVWSTYEGACSTLLPSPETVRGFGEDVTALGLARIEAHYFVNDCFLRPDQLLEDVGRIRHIPAEIVQGRYDMVCPIRSADDLHRAWPEAGYKVVPDAGHSAFEPGIRAALVQAAEKFKKLKA
ncbi:prolyl aminopeptidase [Zavarzinia compransoris]|uniref:Proline iminopeptidase n=1 Tax=Zavarzinia compransoris TaxID=1264899 RepID=A0A317EBJ7_9PROT|nr:prolyl aminopeptidase [Zavarzinia compransoris]PWR24111.1 prolyl aminopeptidase [Zavarzinia compransoris]TDP48057.1 proline iminopeptidase [Zavarzinia compransoris]